MSDVAIRVTGLSKRYEIGRVQRADTFRDALVGWWQGEKGGKEAFWALRDVSFEVKQGEVLGIIGRNGAGKSTLLKILSQITEPTMGKVELFGRVGSLLEVGTGFHPELSGRENIFLNGAILGMKRAEIVKQFDEIVAFSEIEKFLDTPVKHYSSGMYVRLAFAVAAHLEPEILLVDEVLAVGDAAFQQKCLKKMGEAAHIGRTILFVSHNTNAIQRLCPNSLLFDQGALLAYEATNHLIPRYLSHHSELLQPHQWAEIVATQSKGSSAHFTRVRLHNLSGELEGHAYVDAPLAVTVEIKSAELRLVGSMAITFYDEHGTKLVNCDTITLGRPIPLQAGINQFTFHIAQLHLNPGIYTLGLWLANQQHDILDQQNQAVKVELFDTPSTPQTTRPPFDGLVSNQFRLEEHPFALS